MSVLTAMRSVPSRVVGSTIAMLLAFGSAACGAPPREPTSARVAPPPPPVAPSQEVMRPSPPPSPSALTSSPTFNDDLAFLEKFGKVLVLTNPEGGKVALSADYQGRVMTSGVAATARSLGWINRPFIESGKKGTGFDNYGGEDRFWLGPEGGQFGLYFPPGKPFAFDTWQTPHAMQEGAWTVAEEKKDTIVFKRKMTVSNWSNTEFRVDVERTARVLGREEAKKLLGLPALADKDTVGFVGFETKNKIQNDGKSPWVKDKGLLSIWILGMFAPAPDAKVVIPFETNVRKGTEIVNDRYFGKVPADRLAVNEAKGFLTLKADGKERGKIGLSPARAKDVLGSYSAEGKLLTIVQYDGPKKGVPYVNSMWEKQKEPYEGDVVNSYNDGPTEPGKPALGGFYEIETSSPASVANADGRSSLIHTHRTFHFVGEPGALEPIAKKVLGVSLADIADAGK